MWGSICLYLYPLCRSRFISLCFIFLNSYSFELVLRYLLVSPSLIALIVVGGWYEVAWTYNCLLVGFMWVRMSRIWFWLTFHLCITLHRGM